jgi:hypothetical protein
MSAGICNSNLYTPIPVSYQSNIANIQTTDHKILNDICKVHVYILVVDNSIAGMANRSSNNGFSKSAILQSLACDQVSKKDGIID